jgi:hypothetical protein
MNDGIGCVDSVLILQRGIRYRSIPKVHLIIPEASKAQILNKFLHIEPQKLLNIGVASIVNVRS